MTVHRVGRGRSSVARSRSRDRSRSCRHEHQAEAKRQKRGGARFIMPYGTHKGKAILLVPSGYLRWIVGCDGHQLARRAILELERRDRIKARAGSTI